MDQTWDISREDACSILLRDDPAGYLIGLAQEGKLKEPFPEIDALRGVQQDPVYHPEGDAFVHTMLVLERAASVKGRAKYPLAFMYAALYHDVGKAEMTLYDHNKGRWTSIGHEEAGASTAWRAVMRLTGDEELAEYVENMARMHMRPHNIPTTSKPKYTNRMFDASVCPEDLLLLFACDARPEDGGRLRWLESRLAHYREVTRLPEVTAEDLDALGYVPETAFPAVLAKCRQVYLAEVPKETIFKGIPCLLKGIQLEG